jgi:hypothetical protein
VALDNPCDEALAVLPQPWAPEGAAAAHRPDQLLLPLPTLEQRLHELIGLPHNYDGFPPELDGGLASVTAAVAVAEEARVAAAAAAAAAAEAARVAEQDKEQRCQQVGPS